MSKLPDVGTTIFTVMSKLASEHKAINLSQGFPNFPVDEKLKSILKEKVKEKVHQYMPMPGDEQLRKKVVMRKKVVKKEKPKSQSRLRQVHNVFTLWA